MKFILASFLIICSAMTGEAQSVTTGKIIDAKNGEGIPYVNIGIPARTKGTVSDENGFFKLMIVKKEDLVEISSIGYATQTITVAELLNAEIVKLTPMIHDIQEIVVVASKFGKELILGRKLKKRYKSISFSSQQLGTELSACVKIDKKTYLKTANFTLNHVKEEDVLFRLKIYSYKDKIIGESLLKENMLLSPSKKGRLTVDLSSHNLIVEDDIILSIELIKGDGNSITFNAKKTFSGKHTFMKSTSNSPFRRFNEMHAFAPKLQLDFFLEGQEVRK